MQARVSPGSSIALGGAAAPPIAYEMPPPNPIVLYTLEVELLHFCDRLEP